MEGRLRRGYPIALFHAEGAVRCLHRPQGTSETSVVPPVHSERSPLSDPDSSASVGCHRDHRHLQSSYGSILGGPEAGPAFVSCPHSGVSGGYGVRRLVLVLGAAILLASSGCAIIKTSQPDREQLLERILPSSVQIVLDRDGQRFRSGSGVAIAARASTGETDCYVLTSGHTLSRRLSEDRVYVLFGRDHGAGTKVPATVLAHRDDDDIDLALLRAQTRQCFPAQFGQPPRLGIPIWVVAYPWGRNMTLVAGIVSQVNVAEPDKAADRDTAPQLIVDASVSLGASGGGVFDETTGRLLGLVQGYRTARVSFQVDASQQHIDMPVPGETYVVPLDEIQRFLIQANRKDLLGNFVARK